MVSFLKLILRGIFLKFHPVISHVYGGRNMIRILVPFYVYLIMDVFRP